MSLSYIKNMIYLFEIIYIYIYIYIYIRWSVNTSMYVDTGCCLEYLPVAMDDTDGFSETERETEIQIVPWYQHDLVIYIYIYI